MQPRTQRLESQTLRALLEMRELVLRGAFRPGERLREVPLAARLNVSRTPLRLVLDRLAQEGLLKARPTGGFIANEFSVEDIRDAIEIRGVLEGAAPLDREGARLREPGGPGRPPPARTPYQGGFRDRRSHDGSRRAIRQAEGVRSPGSESLGPLHAVGGEGP